MEGGGGREISFTRGKDLIHKQSPPYTNPSAAIVDRD